MSKWTLICGHDEFTILDEKNAVVYEIFKRKLMWELGDMSGWCFNRSLDFFNDQLAAIVEAHNLMESS